MIWWLLACTEPVRVDTQVNDAVHGGPRVLQVVWQTEARGCTRRATSNPAGRVRTKLCPETLYTVGVEGAEVWPEVTGLSELLIDVPITVIDAHDGPTLLGGGSVPLDEAVDVRWVRPRKHDGPVAVPAIMPVNLPTWTASQGLFVPEELADFELVPVVPNDAVALVEDGPLQPWYAFGAAIDEEGTVTPVPAVEPKKRTALPGGTLWRGVPAGTYALWDGQLTRTVLLQVE